MLFLQEMSSRLSSAEERADKAERAHKRAMEEAQKISDEMESERKRTKETVKRMRDQVSVCLYMIVLVGIIGRMVIWRE